MYFKLSVIAVISCLVCVSAADETKPVVGVFYETYCKDSIKFITQQLYPAYLALNSSLFVPHLVPFGNANVTGNGTTTTISCQHGEKECYGNKVHACVLAETTPTLQSKLKFINCSLTKTDLNGIKPYPLEECAKESQLDEGNITKCVNSSQGIELLVENGKATKTYNFTSVPSVTFDGVFDKARSDKSVADFSSVLCDSYFKNNTKADVLCKKNSNSATAATLTVLPVIVFTFLFSKMY